MLTGKDIAKITALATGAFVLKSTLSRFFEYDLKDKTVLITGGSRGLEQAALRNNEVPR